ncbi:MAG: glucose-1-phosphate adenylyltransferase subunit GlgD [Ruminococcaceae bacterium]|nr:glucose-1-phosphate adenylyltransferase subunit GlgD [Oscillospiraceae bacterium]
MTVAGLIFSNIHDSALPELTRMRTIASVPFGCKYRLIDFPLSNMVNSGINKVGIVTHYNYQSLLDHIGTGKDWDLARRSGGIKILPPFITAYDNAAANKLYNTRLEALLGVMNFIRRCNEDYIVMSDCDIICNIDIADVLDKHVAQGADITIATKRIAPKSYSLSNENEVIITDSDGNIKDITEYTATEDEIDISMNVIVIKRVLLENLLLDAAAHGFNSFYRDIVGRNIGKLNIKVYRYDGYYSLVGSLESYFHASMKLLRPEARAGLFSISNRPVYTKVRNTPPAKYIDGSKVSNSLVADGCVIEGRVENSILFRGVKVGRGTVVKNSILMQDTYVGNDVKLNCVISDKNVMIKDGRELSGHESMPFFLGKGVKI